MRQKQRTRGTLILGAFVELNNAHQFAEKDVVGTQQYVAPDYRNLTFYGSELFWVTYAIVTSRTRSLRLRRNRSSPTRSRGLMEQRRNVQDCDDFRSCLLRARTGRFWG